MKNDYRKMIDELLLNADERKLKCVYSFTAAIIGTNSGKGKKDDKERVQKSEGGRRKE